MPLIHKNRIHVGSSKFHGSMLSLIFHFFYAVLSLQIEVGPIIFWLVVGGVACLRINGEIWWDCRICVALSSKWLSWPSKKRTWGFIMLDPQVLLKRLIAFIQPSLSIYTNGVLWTSQSLGRFQ